MEHYRQIAALPLVALVALAIGAGCATELEPAPRAEGLEGVTEGAEATSQQVRVVTRLDAWDAPPQNLGEEVTPILVTIENRSDKPLRVRYRAFQLRGEGGQVLAALPPFQIEGDVVVNRDFVGAPYYDMDAFYVDEPLTPYYEGIDPVGEVYDIDNDPVYYETWYDELERVDLPTETMVRRALPQGVLEPGGTVTGFLYFENVTDEVREPSFIFELVNARTGQQFGVVDIPYVTE